MILQRLNIESFRGMSGVLLDRLAPVTLVVGANNAGKSSVLEAASLVLRPFDPAQWVQVARQRDLDMESFHGLWSLFPSSVPLDGDDALKQTEPLVVEGQIGGVSRRLSVTATASFHWDAEAVRHLNLCLSARVEVGGNRTFTHLMEFGREASANRGSQIPSFRCFTVTPAMHLSTKQLVEHLSKAVDEGKKDLAIELLRLFDPEVQGLDISASLGRDGIRVTHASRGVVDLTSFGDGMRRSAALALALVRAHGGLLLIDELEAGIHTSILSKILTRLVQAAKLADVQILATTHSLELIDAIAAAVGGFSDHAMLYYLQRDNQQHIVRSYDQERMIQLREGGLDLR